MKPVKNRLSASAPVASSCSCSPQTAPAPVAEDAELADAIAAVNALIATLNRAGVLKPRREKKSD